MSGSAAPICRSRNSQAVYERMKTERSARGRRVPRPGRPEGTGDQGRKPTGRQLSSSPRPFEPPSRRRGAGDAERNRLFAEAYGKDPDFFAFYRSMTAYETGLKSNDTRFLLRPDSEFFRLFANPSGHPPAAAGRTEAVGLRGHKGF